MDVRFINPFISATSEVLEQGVQLQAVRGQISLKKSAHTTEEVTLLIRLRKWHPESFDFAQGKLRDGSQFLLTGGDTSIGPMRIHSCQLKV